MRSLKTSWGRTDFEIVIVPAAPENDEDIFELVTLHPMLGFERRMTVEIIAKRDDLLVGHCMKRMEFLDASPQRFIACKRSLLMHDHV